MLYHPLHHLPSFHHAQEWTCRPSSHPLWKHPFQRQHQTASTAAPTPVLIPTPLLFCLASGGPGDDLLNLLAPLDFLGPKAVSGAPFFLPADIHDRFRSASLRSFLTCDTTVVMSEGCCLGKHDHEHNGHMLLHHFECMVGTALMPWVLCY